MKDVVIRDAIRRIDGWLSREPAFCYDSGAVAGLTNKNEVVYWYGEIAGYYLSYLASLKTSRSGVQKLKPHAAKQVGRWLQDQWKNGTATTRVYACDTTDWRNNYVFAFDLAMILRGLTSVQYLDTGIWSGRQIAEFIKSDLTDDQGELRATTFVTGNEPPATWSTSIDGYQLKTAAGLMIWGKWFHDPVLYKLGRNTVKRLAEGGVSDWPHLPLHPGLYALEGALLCGLMTPGSMTRPVNKILASIDMTTERTDAITQLLRLVLFSRIKDKRIDALVSRLLDSIDSDGSVVFRVDRTSNERNTWCAIFARQTLCLFQQARRGHQLRPELCI